MPEFFKTIEAIAASRSENHRRSCMTAYQKWCAFLDCEFGGLNAKKAWQTAQADDVISFISWLKKQPGRPPRHPDGAATLSGASIYLTLATLRTTYRRLFQRQLVSANPFIDPSVPRISKYYNEKRKTRAIPFKKVKAILSLPNLETKRGLRDKTLLSLLFGSGLRRSEVQRLRMSDVRTTVNRTCYVNLSHTKAQERQEQVVPGWAEKTLRAYMALRAEEGAHDESPLLVAYRFRGPAEIPSFGFLGEATIWKIFTWYCAQAGLYGFSPHCARKTGVLKLYYQGYRPRDIQGWARHRSLTTTEVYLREEMGPDESPGRNLIFSIATAIMNNPIAAQLFLLSGSIAVS